MPNCAGHARRDLRPVAAGRRPGADQRRFRAPELDTSSGTRASGSARHRRPGHAARLEAPRLRGRTTRPSSPRRPSCVSVLHGAGERRSHSWARARRSGRRGATRCAGCSGACAVADIAMLMYTSGTTAHPKGCRLLARGARAHRPDVRRAALPDAPGDRQFNPLPLFHLATILPFNGCLAVGATLIGMEHFEPGAALELLQAERCTVAFPAFDADLARDPRPPATSRTPTSRALRLVNVNGDPELTAPDRGPDAARRPRSRPTARPRAAA